MFRAKVLIWKSASDMLLDSYIMILIGQLSVWSYGTLVDVGTVNSWDFKNSWFCFTIESINKHQYLILSLASFA